MCSGLMVLKCLPSSCCCFSDTQPFNLTRPKPRSVPPPERVSWIKERRKKRKEGGKGEWEEGRRVRVGGREGGWEEGMEGNGGTSPVPARVHCLIVMVKFVLPVSCFSFQQIPTLTVYRPVSTVCSA